MKKVFKFGIMMIVSLVLVFMTSLQAFATDVSVLDGQLTISDTAGTGSFSDGTYTATVKGGLATTKTSTINIINKSGSKGVISFNYSVSNQYAFEIENESVDANGEYSSVPLDSDSYISISLTAAKYLKTATLTLTNIVFQPVSDSSKVTYVFDNSLGTVTADETAINSGDVKEISNDSSLAMVATPASDAVFVGWVDGDGLIVSRDTSYTQESLGDKTITALFSKDTPYFMVDDKYIFSDLNTAANAGTTVILLCDGTLPTGDYTVPTGATLFIPFDDANTLCTTEPLYEQQSKIGKPTAYRTLTLASGVNIIVNGAISLGGKQSASIGVHGSPIGTYGHIAMESGSTITVNNGANLYAWGYITGSGEITAKSGATVYEDFQLADYRGGDATTSMIGNDYGVFPMSQYYVQNIEVPLTLEAGAIETGFMSLFVSYAGIQTTYIPFIGSDGMFNITDGYVVKDYEETTDRLVIDVYGTLDMKSLTLSMKLSLLGGTQTINSEEYTLPINGNITINAHSGSIINISQDIALLPGGVFKIEENATCKVSSDAKIIVYDKDQWGGYCSQYNYKFKAANYAPGRKYTRTEADLVDAEVIIAGSVDASATDAFVYTTASGANVQGAEGGLVKINSGTDTVTYQVTQNNTDIEAYNEIPVTTALLKNDDGTYTDPEEDTSCLSSYIYSDGKWIAEHSYSEEWTVDVEPTCTTAGSKSHHCLNCEDVKTDITVIDALGHDEISHEAKAAACEAIGWDAYETCSRCDYTTYNEIGALGHDEISHEAKAAACEAIGWDAYETCSRCDYTTYNEIGALGHSYGEWVAADENNHKRVCSNDSTHIETAEHTFTDNTCSVCGYSLPSIGETTGWESIKEAISETQEEVTVEMNGVEEVPAEVFETIATANTTVEFKINDEISWTINGDEISEDVDFSEINLNVELNTGTIDEEIVNTVEAEETIQLELAHNGEFGFTMYLSFELGADKAGKWANLYYFNTDTQSLEFQESVIVDENGVAEFSFSHASSYAVAIDDDAHCTHEFVDFKCRYCESEKIATATYEKTDDEKLAIAAEFKNFELSGDEQIMIATYASDGKLLNMAIGEAATLSSKDVSQIKVFVWSSLETITPVSLSETVSVTDND